MNIIINKFQLPCDMKYEIDSFCYDNCGYTSEEIDSIKILKKKYRSNFLRIKIDFGKEKFNFSFPQNICFAKSLSHFFTEMKIYSFASQMTLRSIVFFAKINSQIKIELLAWKNQNLSIIWLKPTKHGKSGYYISDEDERNSIDDALFNNIINKDEWAELMNTFI